MGGSSCRGDADAAPAGGEEYGLALPFTEAPEGEDWVKPDVDHITKQGGVVSKWLASV